MSCILKIHIESQGVKAGCNRDWGSKHEGTVTSAGSAIFCYDANGNMTQKIAGSTTSYTYDAENRMTAVSGAASATFVYDGDGRDLCTPSRFLHPGAFPGERSERGNRVKGTVGGATTTYIGNYFEWSPSGKPTLRVQAGSTSTMKKYYYAAGTRVAERKGTTLYWLLGDHQPLQGAPRGSTSITAYSSGGSKTAELRYKPCPLRGCSARVKCITPMAPRNPRFATRAPGKPPSGCRPTSGWTALA